MRKIIKNKRGQETLLNYVVYILIFIVLFVALISFIFLNASGSVIKHRIISKQLALILDQAEPGDVITIEHEENIKIEIENKNVKVKRGKSGANYYYPFYNKNKINLIEENLSKTIIKIE